MCSLRLLESIDSSRHPGTFDGSVINEEDEREILRLLARSIDMDDSLYQLKLELRARGPHVFVSELSRIFGRRVELGSRRHRKHVVREKRPCECCECLDAYEIPLADDGDPGLLADLHMAEELLHAEHPEVRKEEFFLGNVDVDSFNLLTWKTKRLGATAYSDTGRPLKNHVRPLFVSRQEVFEAGLPAFATEED